MGTGDGEGKLAISGLFLCWPSRLVEESGEGKNGVGENRNY